MTTVQHILDAKGREVWSIDKATPVLEAIKLMAEKEIGALVVMDGETFVGIISERDSARKVILKGRSSQETATEAIMTRRVVYVEPSTPLKDCMALMSEKKIRHLPVLESGKLVGMISMRDLLHAMVEHQQFTIEQLERYING